MTTIRSLAFSVLFYAFMALYLIVFLPIFAVSTTSFAWSITRVWARMSLGLFRIVVGTHAEFTGKANIPKTAAIIAPKHQSYWETLALVPELERPAFILKKELMRIPLFGWYAARLGMIPVDRTRRGATLASMLDGATKAAAEGRHIVIFPEGTRTAPGETTSYKSGAFFLYDKLGLPVVPAGLNSGLYWPKKKGPYRPGTVRVAFQPAIEPGLDRTEFTARLEAAIEGSSTDLLRQAYAQADAPPMTAAVRLKVEGIG
ncbi:MULTISPECIES: lysophospholipid acyltransferase family protein [unclassified Aureimonas]|uniref:lysophospholipid acyltransferase family protein n=1 Tax=unclassified Aureimonas TaxID=2615206 RepID=UPI0006FC0286|nr:MULTISPECIES: lysophospholipid acyltransferase family protein [unclassified Aureimonas]KQT53969.1 acyl-phosphate glycerol 3-phosphate acyltransferase [Aureimonas sp. Leaf427]KQT71591.1 acyl-phosphate glycerol 3-phosphate acyltransferase [Aureimonas sp. Leaf460]